MRQKSCMCASSHWHTHTPLQGKAELDAVSPGPKRRRMEAMIQPAGVQGKKTGDKRIYLGWVEKHSLCGAHRSVHSSERPGLVSSLFLPPSLELLRTACPNLSTSSSSSFSGAPTNKRTNGLSLWWWTRVRIPCCVSLSLTEFYLLSENIDGKAKNDLTPSCCGGGGANIIMGKIHTNATTTTTATTTLLSYYCYYYYD